MTKARRKFRSLSVASVLAVGGGVLGCHNATLCEPTSAAMGQVVTTGVSEEYLAQVDKAGVDVPHLACKAEANIATAKLFLRESEEVQCQDVRGLNCIGSGDTRTVAPKANVHMMQGEFRVLGIAKGVGIEDCGRSAIKACNSGIDAYYHQQRAVRPPTVECRLLDYQNF